MSRRIALLVLALAALSFGQKKYNGPRPPKPDVPYLMHASNLVETEVGVAQDERRKDDVANIVRGASSPARTPLAEPIFILQADRLQPDRLEIFKMVVKGGQREALIPNSPKKRGNVKPIRMSVTRLEGGLYKLEANQGLENGEYCISPAASQQVFCFQVY